MWQNTLDKVRPCSHYLLLRYSLLTTDTHHAGSTLLLTSVTCRKTLFTTPSCSFVDWCDCEYLPDLRPFCDFTPFCSTYLTGPEYILNCPRPQSVFPLRLSALFCYCMQDKDLHKAAQQVCAGVRQTQAFVYRSIHRGIVFEIIYLHVCRGCRTSQVKNKPTANQFSHFQLQNSVYTVV